MPSIGPLALLSGTNFAVQTFVNGQNISAYVPWDLAPFTVSESGGTEPGQADFIVVDKNLNATLQGSVTDEAYVRVQRAGNDIFRGFIRSRQPRVMAIGATYQVTCQDIGDILDKTLVVSNSRAAGESDATRIKYFLANYLQDAHFSSDVSQIQTLNANMPAQHFRYLTLRQSIERILGAASPSANYYVDASGRLHTFDSNNPENNAAPYNVKVSTTLAANELAPEDLQIDFDTSSLINFCYIRGKTAGGSGFFPPADLSPYSGTILTAFQQAIRSQSLYGVRQAYQDGPDASTASDAVNLAAAVFADNAMPIARGQFTVHTPYDQRNGVYWRAGQIVNITSAMHGMNAKPMRIAKVTSEFVAGDGRAKVTVEFGGLLLRLRAAGVTNNAVGAQVLGLIS